MRPSASSQQRRQNVATRWHLRLHSSDPRALQSASGSGSVLEKERVATTTRFPPKEGPCSCPSSIRMLQALKLLQSMVDNHPQTALLPASSRGRKGESGDTLLTAMLPRVDLRNSEDRVDICGVDITSPNGVALAAAMALSTSRKVAMPTTGPNASSRITSISPVVSVRMVGGRTARPRRARRGGARRHTQVRRHVVPRRRDAARVPDRRPFSIGPRSSRPVEPTATGALQGAHEPIRIFCSHRLMDEDAIDAAADLPGVAKRALHAVGNSAAEIGPAKTTSAVCPPSSRLSFSVGAASR